MTRPAGHDYFRLLAAAGIDGELTSSQALDLQAHLADCPACRADERAMQRDHAWLASAAAGAPVPASVRDVVLGAAQGHALSRGRGVPRLATTLAFVVAVGGLWWLGSRQNLQQGGVSPSASAASNGPTSGPTEPIPASREPLAPDQWPVPPGTPFARAEARLVGNSTGAAPEIQATAIVIGGDKGAPQGYVDFSDPTGESWFGSITRASYGYGADGQWYVARIEGCVGGGVAPCDLYALQFIDGRDRPDEQDEISLTFVTQGVDPEPWAYWYRLVSGSIVVDGPIPGAPPPATTAPSK